MFEWIIKVICLGIRPSRPPRPSRTPSDFAKEADKWLDRLAEK